MCKNHNFAPCGLKNKDTLDTSVLEILEDIFKGGGDDKQFESQIRSEGNLLYFWMGHMPCFLTEKMKYMIQSKYRYNLSHNIDIDYGCINL